MCCLFYIISISVRKMNRFLINSFGSLNNNSVYTVQLRREGDQTQYNIRNNIKCMLYADIVVKNNMYKDVCSC